MTKTAPAHLRPKTRAWWRSVVSSWELAEHHERLLTAAAEFLDRKEEALEILRKEGLTFTDKHGQPRAHPAAAIARDSAIGYSRCLRELDLDISEMPEATRPPMLRRYRSA